MKTHQIKIIYLLSLLVMQGNFAITRTTPCIKHNLLKESFSGYFNEVNTYLKQSGFTEGFFVTSDNLRINYLFLKRPKAKHTLICCSGWLPGRKESMAPLYALLPEDCNLFFFDARGHGKSEGPLFRNLWWYGQQEYLDIIGAIQFVHKHISKPIFLYGTCAGAFHAAHALAHLNKKALNYQVKGLIFDSGWTSVLQVSYSVINAGLQDMILSLIQTYSNKPDQNIRKSLFYKTSYGCILGAISLIRSALFTPIFNYYDHQTNLENTISKVYVPIFFIHAYNDQYVDINKVKKLACKVPSAQTWWIEAPSQHARHVIMFQEEYCDRMLSFIRQHL